jgi:hypothetical protein
MPVDDDTLDTEDSDSMNNGGRVFFRVGEQVTILNLDGQFSPVPHFIAEPRSDRKGLISLNIGKSDGQRVKVHSRRVVIGGVPASSMAIVSNNDQYTGVCPTCGAANSIASINDKYVCGKCSTEHTPTWLGKPMSDAEIVVKKEPGKGATAPKEAKTRERQVKEPVRVDFATLAATPDCQLYTKGQIKFDHELIDVQAHVLVYTGATPRKLCFNTYNGALGQKSEGLPLTEFLADQDVPGTKKKPWFAVKNLDTTRNDLLKSGYVLYGTEC